MRINSSKSKEKVIPISNLKHTSQRQTYDCGIDCAAMVAGIKYEDAVKAHDSDPNKITNVVQLNKIQCRRKTGMWMQRKKNCTVPARGLSNGKVKQDFKKKIESLGKSLLIRVAYPRGGHWVLYDSNSKNESERIKDPDRYYKSPISLDKFVYDYLGSQPIVKHFDLRIITESKRSR